MSQFSPAPPEVETINVTPASYIYVGKNGNDASGDGSAGKPYLTVSKAISMASAGTTIFIWPGTYTESLTLKPGVNLTSSAQYSVYIIGNHVYALAGTVLIEKIVLQNAASAASGTTLSVSGSAAVNLQLYGSFVNSVSTSGDGDAVNWTNTNASSKFQIIDGNISVLHSGSTARAFYSTTGAKGGVIANRATIQVNNPDNVCISLGGAMTFVHTADAITGQIVISDTASGIFAMLTGTTIAQPIITTNSSGMSVFMNVIANTTASPVAAGAGGLTVSALIYGSTGMGAATTLNGGAGPIFLPMGPIRVRNSPALLPAGAVAAGLLDGVIEVSGTHAYMTIGTTRSMINLTAT